MKKDANKYCKNIAMKRWEKKAGILILHVTKKRKVVIINSGGDKNLLNLILRIRCESSDIFAMVSESYDVKEEKAATINVGRY